MTESTEAKKLKVSCTIPGGIELQITREAGSTAFPGARVAVPYGSPVAIPGGGASHALVDAAFMETWFAQNKNNDALKRCLLVEDPDAPAPTDNVEKSDDAGAGQDDVALEKLTDGGEGVDKGDTEKLTDVGISNESGAGAAPKAVVIPGDLSAPKISDGAAAKPADDPIPPADDPVQTDAESATEKAVDKPADDPA